jgi:small subunit ribosomal protein S20
MPQKRAAKKALRQNVKQREANLKTREDIKNTIKKFKKAIESKDSAATAAALQAVYKVLDKAASKHVIHPNKAARKKSRLAHLLRAPATQKSA